MSTQKTQPDALFDEHGYPHEATLDLIEHWPGDDLDGLFNFLQRCWKYPKYFTRDGNRIEMSTGGWSGNESIIDAFQANDAAWLLCWVQSRRGGHYVFEIPKKG